MPRRPARPYGDAPWIARGAGVAAPTVAHAATDPLTRRTAVTDRRAAWWRTESRSHVITAVVPVRQIADGLETAFAGPRELTFTVVEPAPGSIRSASGVEGEQWKPVGGSGFDAERSGTWTALDGRERLFASAAVPAAGLAGLRRSRHRARSPPRRARRPAARGSSRSSPCSRSPRWRWLVSRRIVRPLQAVTDAIVAARDEPMPAPVPVEGPREVAVLADRVQRDDRRPARLRGPARRARAARRPHPAARTGPCCATGSSGSIRADDAPARRVAVLFLDLDRFKLVNDSLGHPAGDSLLRLGRGAAERAVRPHDTLARFGGDEFVVVCEDVDGAPGAVEIADRLEAALAAPFSVGGQEIDVSAKVGIALADGPGPTPDELVREADIAMYQAKDSGRAWELWDDDLQGRSAHRLELQQDLRARGPQPRARRRCTSRSGTSRTGGSSAPRRSCAGTTRGSAGSRPASSSRSPRTRARSRAIGQYVLEEALPLHRRR